MAPYGIVFAWLLLVALGAALTARLVSRVWRQRHDIGLMAKLFAALAAIGASFGLLGTLLGLVMVFGAVGGESVDPSQKARLVAEGISEAMNCTALGLIVCVPSLIVLSVLTRKRKSGSEPPKRPGVG